MSITIENPTAEAALEALQQLPLSELERLKALLGQPANGASRIHESTEWSDEDLSDFSAAGAALYEEIEAQEMKNAAPR